MIKPREHQVAYAIGTIFTFNIIAVLAFPPIGHALGMDGHSLGFWSGTAINDTSLMVAAGLLVRRRSRAVFGGREAHPTPTLIPVRMAGMAGKEPSARYEGYASCR